MRRTTPVFFAGEAGGGLDRAKSSFTLASAFLWKWVAPSSDQMRAREANEDARGLLRFPWRRRLAQRHLRRGFAAAVVCCGFPPPPLVSVVKGDASAALVALRPFAPAPGVLGLGMLDDELGNGPAQASPRMRGLLQVCIAMQNVNPWSTILPVQEGREAKVRRPWTYEAIPGLLHKNKVNMQQSQRSFTHQADSILEGEGPLFTSPLVGRGHGYAIRRSGLSLIVEPLALYLFSVRYNMYVAL